VIWQHSQPPWNICVYIVHTPYDFLRKHSSLLFTSAIISLCSFIWPLFCGLISLSISVSFSFELLVPIPPSVCLSLKVFRVSRDVSSINHVSTSLQQLPLIRSKDQVFFMAWHWQLQLCLVRMVWSWGFDVLLLYQFHSHYLQYAKTIAKCWLRVSLLEYFHISSNNELTCHMNWTIKRIIRTTVKM